MKQLLCTISDEGEPIVCRVYFATETSRKSADSPDYCCPLQDVIAVALEEAQRQTGQPCWLREISLQTLTDPDRYYFFTAECRPEGYPDVDEVSILIDLDGDLINPEIHIFDDSDDYYAFIDELQ